MQYATHNANFLHNNFGALGTKFTKFAYFSPSAVIFYILLIFNFFPAIFIKWTYYKEALYFEYSDFEYFSAVDSYLYCTVVFLICYAVAVKAFGRPLLLARKPLTDNTINVFYNRPISRTYDIMCAVGVLVTLIYFVSGGYEKLLLFSSNMDSWAFRIVGYDDRSRFLIAGLEASRRVLLPMGACFLFLKLRLLGMRSAALLLTVVSAFQLLGAVMTLDRAPILLFLVQFVFLIVCLGASFGRMFLIGFISMLLVVLVAGVTTFLQYNISSFSFDDVQEAGYNFLVHRTILVPSVASIELSFAQFPDDTPKLFLAYSRLGALVGRDYVGTEALASLYVTPVGLIGDVWRNLGMVGIAMSGFIIGTYFAWIDRMTEKLRETTAIIHSFNALSLGCYYIFGVLFSQGVLFQMLLGAILLKWEVGKSRPIR